MHTADPLRRLACELNKGGHGCPRRGAYRIGMLGTLKTWVRHWFGVLSVDSQGKQKETVNFVNFPDFLDTALVRYEQTISIYFPYSLVPKGFPEKKEREKQQTHTHTKKKTEARACGF